MEQIHGGDIYKNPGVLDFSVNVNPLRMPESVIRAAKEAAALCAHYPDMHKGALIGALSRYENVPEEYIIAGNGAAELIFAFAFALKADKALIAVPCFSEYERAFLAAGSRIVKYRMPGLEIKEDIFEYLTDDTDAVFLCSPNNPTGFLIEKGLLKEIADTCKKRNIVLMIDECFLGFVSDEERFSLKGYIKDNDKIFVLDSFTKKYAMPGLRLGYGLCSDMLLTEKMKACLQPWNISLVAQAAGIAALKEEEYLNSARALIKEQKKYMKAEMEKIGLEVFGSKANFIFFKGPEGLCEACLKEGILIRDCSGYEGLENGFYRAAVLKEPENRLFLDTLRSVLS